MITKFFKYIKESQDEDELILNNHNIDEILESYLKTALWCEGESDEYEDLTIYDFSNDALKKAKKEIFWFVTAAGEILDNCSSDFIGSNIWYEREGHGVGFWDKDEFNDEEKEILHELANVLGFSGIYVSDDKKIEFCSSTKYKDFDLQKYKEELELKKQLKKFNL